MTYEEAFARLTAPGGPFEMEEVEVRGRMVRDYVRRPRSLRAVAEAAAGWGDREFLVQGERRESYAEVFAAANRIAHGLEARRGPLKGERIALLGANSIDWSIALWAGINAGAVVAALNAWWKADEILHALNDCGARVLIADRQRLDRIEGRLAEVPTLAEILVIGEDDLAGSAPPHMPATPLAEDDPACIFYTSGTTGRSKGAVITHRSWIAAMTNFAFAGAATALQQGAPPPAGDRAPDVLLATLPLFHVGGCHSTLIASTSSGARVVFPEGRFEPQTTMALIERERVTRWSAVPTMLWRMHADPARGRFDVGSVRAVSYGGSPSSADLALAVRDIFPNAASVSNAYGLTETGTVFTLIAGQDLAERPGAVGRPLPTAEVRILEGTGEIAVRGPMLMAGYWGEDPEVTLPDGWLHTGDVGRLDVDGFLYVTDRAKDMLIRGGENIYPVEVEMRLEAHPDIVEAAVIGAPHPELGEEVHAIVRLREGATLAEEEVRAWAREGLADFKAPAIVEFRAGPLPRNATGKLMKALLKAGEASRFVETL